ncbi:MAG: hypothetical protein C0179_00675 [Fervidicoccus sp.]|nr:MAG: hypothetical protein C0179_00675 [Fervidicoccus sp.]
MVFESLKVVPKQRITSLWANTLVDAIELAYNLGRRGDPDYPFSQLYGYYGFFDQALFVQGRPVIKDGDPISLYDIFSYAQQKITSAIDSARITSTSDLIRLYTQESRDILGALYEKTPSKADVLEAIETSITSMYIREVRDKLVAIAVDEYGNVGIRIAEPLDVYGRVKATISGSEITVPVTIQGSAIMVPVDIQSQVSDLTVRINSVRKDLVGSTTTALGANASVTLGPWDALSYKYINISVFADQPGTLYVEQSPDNKNWDISESISVSANVGQGISREIIARHIRVRYVNGATAQTVFRLYVWLRTL